MKLSIIVPVYNMSAGGKLKYCLDSLVNQTLEDYEIIAVDDASTDTSPYILSYYADKYPDKFRAVYSPVNQKQGGARNLGLKQAQGEWIGFMDSDDWAAPDMFAKLLNKAEETGADVVGCDYCLTHVQSFEKGKRISSNDSSQTGRLTEDNYKKLILSPGSMVIKIYRRELFFRHQLWFPEKMFYEDNYLAPMILLYARQFERVEEDLYYYYQHATSTVHHISREKCDDRLHAMDMFWEECRKRGFYSRFQAEIDYRFFELYYYNTLFTYLRGVRFCKVAYLDHLKAGLLARIPDFRENPYYQERMDAESKKLIDMHMKSSRKLLWYYKLLLCYRRIRYGRQYQKG